jgi:formylglycine-generating enzyme required for sulfatase activity
MSRSFASSRSSSAPGAVEAALNGWLARHPTVTATPVAPRRDPAKYLQWLREQTATIDIRGLQVVSGKVHRFPIEDLYIPLTTVESAIEEGKRGMEARAPVRLEGALRHQRLVIVGDPGSGKTTFLLLDGLDEAPSRKRRESMARLFERATQTYGSGRFVVTTRPQAYEGRATLDGFQQVRIDDLGDDAIAGFLDHWSRSLYPESPSGAASHLEALRGALRARVEIRRMARNPVMLTSILTWLARSREKEGRQPAERCLALLGHLALAMQDQREGRITEAGRGRAAEMIAPRFREVPEDERVRQARSFLEQEETDSGIIVIRGSELRFWHLTFQEYLAALAIAGLGDAAQQKLLLAGDRLYQPEWREVMRLLGGILAKQGVDKVDGLFYAVLDRVSERASLAEKARSAGLLGAMLEDLRPLRYQPADRRYGEMLEAVRGIFDARKAAGIDLRVRLEAAEALGQAGDPRLREDNWATIPAGAFPMGDPAAGEDASPMHEVYLDAYQIGRYPVTVEEYRRFIEDEGYQNKQWWQAGGFGERTQMAEWYEQVLHPNRPVVWVTWYEAAAYCAWAGGRLPTEAQWERAARGTKGRKYPWGNDKPDSSRANYYETKIGHASPVGLFPRGATPEGIQDLAGNVWEWVRDWYGEDYYRRSLRKNTWQSETSSFHVVRGGCFYDVSELLRAAVRLRSKPDDRLDWIGFRCARDVEPGRTSGRLTQR